MISCSRPNIIPADLLLFMLGYLKQSSSLSLSSSPSFLTLSFSLRMLLKIEFHQLVIYLGLL